MSINPKDTIIAFSYAWSIYLILRYFKYQHIKKKRNYYSLLLGIVIGLGSGVRPIFIFSLFPIILIIIFEFFLSSLLNKINFELKNKTLNIHYMVVICGQLINLTLSI